MSLNFPSILRAPPPSVPGKQDLGEGLAQEGGLISVGWGMRGGVGDGVTQEVEFGAGT